MKVWAAPHLLFIGKPRGSVPPQIPKVPMLYVIHKGKMGRQVEHQMVEGSHMGAPPRPPTKLAALLGGSTTFLSIHVIPKDLGAKPKIMAFHKISQKALSLFMMTFFGVRSN